MTATAHPSTDILKALGIQDVNPGGFGGEWVGSGPDLGNTSLQAIGRLRAGVSVEQAQTEMTAIAERLANAYPQSNAGIGVIVEPFLDTFFGSELPALLYTMLGAVFGVLGLAGITFLGVGFLLAQPWTAEREIAIGAQPDDQHPRSERPV